MKTLVTGAAGFIGSALSKALLADGHDVVGIDSVTDYYDTAIKRRNLAPLLADGLTFVEQDLNAADLTGILADVDWVFHLAGQPGVRASWGTQFDHYVRDNVSATQALLEAATHAPRLSRLVCASSSSVYGDNPSHPTSETDHTRPVSPYGVTKLAAEQLASMYAASFGVPAVVLRYFTVFGPGQRPDMAISRFISAATAGAEITVFGDGEQSRDFTYVDDVVSANVLAAAADLEPGSVFNVAGGVRATVNELLETIGSQVGRPLSVHRVAPAKGDVRHTGGDTARLRHATGWMPVTDLEQGIANQAAWLRSLGE